MDLPSDWPTVFRDPLPAVGSFPALDAFWVDDDPSLVRDKVSRFLLEECRDWKAEFTIYLLLWPYAKISNWPRTEELLNQEHTPWPTIDIYAGYYVLRKIPAKRANYAERVADGAGLLIGSILLEHNHGKLWRAKTVLCGSLGDAAEDAKAEALMGQVASFLREFYPQTEAVDPSTLPLTPSLRNTLTFYIDFKEKYRREPTYTDALGDLCIVEREWRRRIAALRELELIAHTEKSLKALKAKGGSNLTT